MIFPGETQSTGTTTFVFSDTAGQSNQVGAMLKKKYKILKKIRTEFLLME
jgi:hypothetical protein